MVARMAVLIGEVGNAALGIESVVSDLVSAPFAVLALLIGPQLHYRDDHYFDVQEDAHIHTTGFLDSEGMRLESKFADLVCKPLSQDLPTMKKDILIVAAAWDGNMDRYQRLRRPETVSNEF
ncbi:hypothetical protein CI238_12761 [Colletotrichum incanum]|uniref:Uncharacterized protein n=1 Tax=Colletotrichum incanum TaxID=1573173 RepID=A0A166LRV4_COLIC|nr:hypothetical protein CI238_12761 [Colletotrichum incanum]